MSQRIGTPVAIVVAATLLAGLTYAWRGSSPEPVRPTGPTPTIQAIPGTGGAAALAQAPGRPALGELERLITAFDRQTAGTPNATGFTFLGRLELERARLTGDAGSYARAEEALSRAVEMAPTSSEARSLLASVRFTTHDFAGAYDLASKVFEGSGDLAALAVRGDAALELGRYERAAADYALLADAAPGSSATLIRLARLAFLHADAQEASRLAASAERAAATEGAIGATRAWYATFRGRLALDAGRTDEAAAHLRRARGLAPDYHVAIAGMAAVRTAQGRLGAAIRLYERAVAAVPEPATLASLGDLYAARGDRREAADRYATVEAIAALGSSSGQRYDRQVALYLADHGRDLNHALRIAREGLATRRDVYGYDVLGWVLYRLGRYDEARAAADQAVALGTPDPRIWFHAGMISAALGEEDRARAELGRALGLNPRFDVLMAPMARRTLSMLDGGPA